MPSPCPATPEGAVAPDSCRPTTTPTSSLDREPELFAQVPGLTTIVVPVGGGGLLAGVGLAASGRRGVGVRGVESDASPAVSASMAAGRVVTVAVGATLADGLAGNIEPGAVTVPLITRHVEEMAAVDDESIARAVRFLAFEHGLVVEPSGAVAVAALWSGRLRPGAGPTALVVTGRNVSAALLGRLLAGEPPSGGQPSGEQ
jgi:threonine dehydratase